MIRFASGGLITDGSLFMNEVRMIVAPALLADIYDVALERHSFYITMFIGSVSLYGVYSSIA